MVSCSIEEFQIIKGGLVPKLKLNDFTYVGEEKLI